jgi:hypothetical protein
MGWVWVASCWRPTECVNDMNVIGTRWLLLSTRRSRVSTMLIPFHVGIGESVDLLCKVFVAVLFSVAACSVFHAFFSTSIHVSRDVAVRVLSLPFAHARMEVRQGFKFPSLVADVKGLAAFKDVVEGAICHFPVTIFLGSLIPKILNRRELILAQFYENRHSE